MRIILRTFLFLLTLSFISSTFALSTIKSETDTLKKYPAVKYFSDDIVASSLDCLAVSVLFAGKNLHADTAALNIYKFKPTEVPHYTDEQYKTLFKKLDAKSPFPFVYNEDVRKFIDMYVLKRRKQTSRLLGLAAYYFPLFEESLDKYGLPLELKYLAVIESALNPVAVSRAGAGGLWQFMYRTGKMYGLEVTSYVDDRYDPYKATIAACEHFEDLYNIYQDWALVLAAYNAGSGNVNRAIRKAGGSKDYWQVRRFLPRETQSYVPVFIAATFVLSFPAEHNLYPEYPGYLFTKTDTVTVKQKISFEQLSEALMIPIEELVALNPSFKKNVIPASDEITYTLKLPYFKVGIFLANEEEIYNFKTLEQLIQEDYAQRNNIVLPISKYHTVRKGETLSQISHKYGCKVSDIQNWNKMKGTSINIGKQLIVSNEPAPMLKKPEPPKHTKEVKCLLAEGESLREVSAKYNCSVDELRLWNQIKNLDVPQGTELVVHMPVYENEADSLLALSNNTDTINIVDVSETLDNITSDVSDTINDTLEENIIVKTVPDIGFFYYVVQKGDTLWKIAERYDSVTVEDIKRLNKIEGNSLSPGQKLKLPEKS